MTSQLTEEEEKAKNLGKVKNKQEMMMVDLEGKGLCDPVSCFHRMFAGADTVQNQHSGSIASVEIQGGKVTELFSNYICVSEIIRLWNGGIEVMLKSSKT